MAFKIITDSATDLPKEIVEKYKLHVIPTPVTIDGTDYFDGKTIFQEDFYRIQAQGTDIKTYHINQYMFRENFEPYAKAGDEVLYMCFSTGIAGTFNAANLAKEELLEEYPDFDLTIIDTKCASLGFGLAVEKILRMQANGAPKDLIIEAAQFFCEHMEHIVTVETLEYLYKGGRLSKTSAVLGGVLDLSRVPGNKPSDTSYRVQVAFEDDHSPAFGITAVYSGAMTLEGVDATPDATTATTRGASTSTTPISRTC